MKVKINVILHYWMLFVKQRVLKFLKPKRISKVDDFSFESLFKGVEIPNDSYLYLHVGLAKIKQVSGLSYVEIVTGMINYIEETYTPKAIVVPTFTPHTKINKVYSVRHSESTVGVFSKLFLDKLAEFRSLEMLHSFSVKGSFIEIKENCDFNNTFGENGLYSFLEQRKDTYILNIGTDSFISTQLHRIEHKMEVPYKDFKNNYFDGIVFDENNLAVKVRQFDHKYFYNSWFNRTKIINYLKKHQVYGDVNNFDISISWVNICDLHHVLEEKLSTDAYYLVSF